MSISFFIGPFDPALWEFGDPDPMPTSELHIEPAEYETKLLERFPYAKRYSKDIWSWSLDEHDTPGIYLLLHEDWQYVSFGLGANFVDFILWHRRMIPARHKLFLFNSSSWSSLELLWDTPQSQIEDFTGIRKT